MRLIPSMDVDDSTSLTSTLLGGDEPAGEGAYNPAEGDDA